MVVIHHTVVRPSGEKNTCRGNRWSISRISGWGSLKWLFWVARLMWVARWGPNQKSCAATVTMRAPANGSVEVRGNQNAFQRAIQRFTKVLSALGCGRVVIGDRWKLSRDQAGVG